MATSRSRHRGSHGPTSLSVARVIGAFVIWAVGICFATWIFLIERIIAKLCRQNRITNIEED